MKIIQSIIRLFQNTVYMRVSDERINAHDVESGSVFEVEPVLAIDRESNRIQAIGRTDVDSAVSHYSEEKTRTVELSFTDASFLKNMEEGIALIRYILVKSYPRYCLVRPKVIVHMDFDVNERQDEVLQGIERLLVESGARKICVWQGFELSLSHIRERNFFAKQSAAIENDLGGKILLQR